MYYSPANKVECELHGQDRSHLVISILTTCNNATVYYSPAKFESELHGQDKRKTFVCIFPIHTAYKQRNWSWTTYSPLEVETWSNCKGMVEYSWLFQSKHTNYMLTKQLCTTHQLIKLSVNCMGRIEAIWLFQSQLNATKQLCITHPLKFKVNCMVRIEERNLFAYFQ